MAFQPFVIIRSVIVKLTEVFPMFAGENLSEAIRDAVYIFALGILLDRINDVRNALVTIVSPISQSQTRKNGSSSK